MVPVLASVRAELGISFCPRLAFGAPAYRGIAWQRPLKVAFNMAVGLDGKINYRSPTQARQVRLFI